MGPFLMAFTGRNRRIPGARYAGLCGRWGTDSTKSKHERDMLHRKPDADRRGRPTNNRTQTRSPL